MARGGLESLALAVIAGGICEALALRRELVWLGLGLAWSAGTAGALAVAYGRSRSPAWFWRAFGFGMALRAAVFVGLVAAAWRRPVADAAALLGAYAGGLTAVILLESWRLVQEERGKL